MRQTIATAYSGLGWTWLLAGLLLSLVCLAGSILAPSTTTRSIRHMQLGQRAIAENPNGVVDSEFGDTVDPATWREINLRAPKTNATWAYVDLLRPLTWLEEHAARPGGTIRIDVPECGISGDAEVLAIRACPKIESGPGRIVTGKYFHTAANTINVGIAGLDEPIGCTRNHPFWSEDRQEYVRADDLGAGEKVRTLKGLLAVQSISHRSDSEPVYNLEVQVDHVFHVSVAGVLVHNTFPTLPILGSPCFTPPNLGSTRHIKLNPADNGSYTVTFGSGKKYAGKGPPSRARRSARQRSRENGDPVEGIDHTPASSDAEAFRQEAARLKAIGGPGSPNNYNQINSPGNGL